MCNLRVSYGSKGRRWMMDTHREGTMEERREIYNRG